MELKGYQHKVIKDLERYLEYVRDHKKTNTAFNTYWEDRIGIYNPLNGTGMQPYKNNIPGAPHICIKVPTAGGKTFIACNALHSIFNAFAADMPKMVVWLVPWSNLLDQTVTNLSDPEHPYRRKLDSLFNHRVAVYQKKDVLQGANFNPTVVREQLSILVMSFASLRSKNKEDRKVYQENGQLASFANQYRDKSHQLEKYDDTALINVIRSLNPVLVVDESHNAETSLSMDMLNDLNPSFVLDLTATPKENSNIISHVPAIELKKEHMVKLPVIVYNYPNKTDIINNALHLQYKLEQLAIAQQKKGGKYIRPIVLFQAQPKKGEENTTFEKLKEQLLAAEIPAEQIRIKTASVDELKGVNLQSPDCPVRYIITVNALKEGWDCPFAYILASLADRSSPVDVEQILGRILRQPYVMKHGSPLLNVSYVLTASAKFNDTLQKIVEGLQASGFSERDYRQKDLVTESEKETGKTKALQHFLFPEEAAENDEIEPAHIIHPSATNNANNPEPQPVKEISEMAEQLDKEYDAVIEKYNSQSPEETDLTEMGDKVKRYHQVEAHRELTAQITLPQFFVEIPAGGVFGGGKTLLNQESLLFNFKLGKEDIRIDFDSSSSMAKVDLEETRKDDFSPRYAKVDDGVKDLLLDFILQKPREKQIYDIAHLLAHQVGNIDPIPDQQIHVYIIRILENMTAEQLSDAASKRQIYASRIKAKIRSRMDAFAEGVFNDRITIGTVITEPSWKFPEVIVPGKTGAAITKSLYELEASMNSFETSVITDFAALPNIVFWHRNLVRGKGFAINGFKSNHYPDFILYTQSGKVLLVETKGDDRDNSDSIAKCRLGNKWAELAGKNFRYFMVFEKNAIDGAFNLEKAKELISKL